MKLWKFVEFLLRRMWNCFVYKISNEWKETLEETGIFVCNAIFLFFGVFALLFMCGLLVKGFNNVKDDIPVKITIERTNNGF